MLHIILFSAWAKLACKLGEPYNLCLTSQAILYEESTLCKYRLGDHGKSLGCMQISLGATRRLFPGYPRQSWVGLEHDNYLNIAVGVDYLHYCMLVMGNWWKGGVVCYNVGPNRALTMDRWQIDHFPYLLAVEKIVLFLERHPQTS